MAVKSNDELDLSDVSTLKSTDDLELSEVPPAKIMKIEHNDNYCWDRFVVKFSPSDTPTNFEQFQSAVMKVMKD